MGAELQTGLSPNDARTAVIITGGGTAGHTNPGIAIGQALVADGLPTDQVHFVGGERGNEATLVGEAGFTIDLLPGRGIRRSLSPAALLQNTRSVVALGRGVVEAVRLVRRRRPRVVVCLGGYAAFPTSLAAVLARIPLVVSEQNARASAVNQIFGRWAAANALPYPDTDLPAGTLTGNPIRPEVVRTVQTASPAEARRRLGIDPDRRVVAMWAGSLGATAINRAGWELASAWRDRSDVALYHVIGERDWDDFGARPFAADPGGIAYTRVRYEHDMAHLLAAADVAVCRAGASATAELAIAGVPALLVPLPHAPRDHQRANARELVDVGAAMLIDDGDVTGERLAALLGPLFDEPDRLDGMRAAARSVARPEAAAEVAALVLAVGGLQ